MAAKAVYRVTNGHVEIEEKVYYQDDEVEVPDDTPGLRRLVALGVLVKKET